MKTLILNLFFIVLTYPLFAQHLESIKLNSPNTNRGLPLMKALSLRASASIDEFDTKEISIKDLSDLLWAANGINRPENGKRTAPSALNAQDVAIYLFTKSGVHLYDVKNHKLDQIVKKDNRNLFFSKTSTIPPPLVCLLVSDISLFSFGEKSSHLQWAAMDAGIVTQNILLFCASANMASRPRVSMDKKKIIELLNLHDSQYPMLNVLVSYKQAIKQK